MTTRIFTLPETYAATGWACTDCLILLANSDAPADLCEAETADWLAQIAQRTDGYTLTIGMHADEHRCAGEDGLRRNDCGCDSDPFSWQPCEVCGSHLGGERHAVTFWQDAQ